MGAIYLLLHPQTNEIRYVGQTSRSLEDRLRRHVGGVAGHWPISRWIRKNGVPRIIAVQECPVNQLDANERHWIKELRAAGCRLLNLTDGGGGTRGFTMPEEVRRQISSSKRCCINVDVVQLYINGMSSNEIAARCAVSPTTVLRRLHEASVQLRVGGAKKGRIPASAAKARCQRWRINRSKSCVCGHHDAVDS